MNKLSALWALFRKGESVSNPQSWKTGQITATALGAAILAAVHVLASFGYVLPVDENACTAIAGGIIAIVNIVLTVTTSDKVGLPAKQPIVPSDQPVTTISAADLQAGIDFANQAGTQSAHRGQEG